MIFRKLKREFPQFANLQVNRVSDLDYRQKVQIAKAIYHKSSPPYNGNIIRMRNRLYMYQSQPNNTLSRNLYSALKIYYNEE